MKAFALLALAATAMASACTPPAYACKDAVSWQVCNIDGTWLVSKPYHVWVLAGSSC